MVSSSYLSRILTSLRQLNVNVQTELEKSRNSTSVCLSSCGNYCVVGSNGGTVYLYNAQSGLPRGSFPQLEIDPDVSSLEFQKTKIPGNILHDQKKILGLDGTQDSYRANSLSMNGSSSTNSSPDVSSAQLGHTGAFTGVFLNLVNTVLVTCGLDGLVIFWNFYTHQIESSIQLSSPQCKMEPFREGDLVCVVGQDRMIRMYDLSSKKLCRRFDGKSGHSRAISDICFTPDGRRLLSASYDATVRVWDLPTSRCLSWMKFSAPITSMCMSLSGEYLCLTLADTEGIQMYLDRSLYETVHFWKEPTEPVLVKNCQVKSEATILEGTMNEDDNENEEPVIISAVQAQVNNSEAPEMQKLRKEDMKQRGNGTITMAALPKAYWLTLFNLESIKERNKPTAPPTAPPQAPFFLPTVVKEGGEGGIAPAFPTPAEYAKLQTPQAPETVEKEPTKELTSSWKDDDDEGNDSDWGDSNWNSTSFPDEIGDSIAPEEEYQGLSKKRKVDSKFQSRIIRRTVELPRYALDIPSLHSFLLD
jgi:U3 small nucleolar RNA-associated protein 21